jgi:hypothetical protein
MSAHTEEVVQLRAQISKLQDRLHNYEPNITPHAFSCVDEYERWLDSVVKQFWTLFHHFRTDRALARYNGTGSVELLVMGYGYADDYLNVETTRIIESDEILRQSGVRVTHLLQWTDSFSLWVDEQRAGGHTFDTYAELLAEWKGPFT